MVRLLKRAEVEDLVDLRAAIDCMDRLYRDQANGQVSAQAPTTMRSDEAMMMVRSGGLAGQHRMGFRISRARGRGWALVWDSPAGELQAVVEYPFSDLRVSATIALAVDKLAVSRVQGPGPDSASSVHTVGVIGSSGIAWAGIAGIAAVRRPQQVRVFSRDEGHRTDFANRAREELEIEANSVDSAWAAVEGADLVLVATSSNQPVLESDWLPSECLVVGAGSRAELGPDVYRRAGLIITTSKVHETHVGEWPLVTLIKNEEIGWDTVAELGEIVSGQVKRPRGLTVFREAQGGFSDIALAALAAEKAGALGRGVSWDLD